MLQAREDICDVIITSGGRIIEFQVLVYADDTAVYPCDRCAITRVFTILGEIDNVSGLRTNRANPSLWIWTVAKTALPIDTYGLSAVFQRT